MNINYRIMFQFLTQFILNFIATFLIVVLFIILAMHLITKDELKSNPQKAIVENLPYSSYIGVDGQIELNDSWKSALVEHQMWIQIIDGSGEVIYAFNTPDHFQRI